MNIKDIAIKKIEKLPTHLVFRVSDLIDSMERQDNGQIGRQDGAELDALFAQGRAILEGLKPGLSADIIDIEREDRI